jgi:hypothetical protein
MTKGKRTAQNYEPVNECRFQGEAIKVKYGNGKVSYWRCRIKVASVTGRKWPTNVDVVAFGELAEEMQKVKEGDIVNVLCRFEWSKRNNGYEPNFIVLQATVISKGNSNSRSNKTYNQPQATKRSGDADSLW